MLITKNKTATTILRIIFFSLIFSWIYYYSDHHSAETAKLVKTTDDYLVIQRAASNGGEYKELYIGKQYYFVSDQRYFQRPYIRYVEE
ncbi:hypothetical protein MF628_002789 [Paenibacillus polymyxa]|uniref:hypothetical protein n=1 Tax=Paenibacillus polymyxa TaxID=1406 RepID=UPI0020242D9E|nr:hypothetical protein [Paenibacillus polymyxa]URJ43194.1 hypothetical protein MF628_002789 [Paenibacillus polymyxa]